MGQLRFDIEALRSYANTMNGHISEYEALNAQLEGMSAEIVATWKGEASQAYTQMMGNYVVQAKKLTEILQQFRGYAQNTADQFETLDTSCASRIRQSF